MKQTILVTGGTGFIGSHTTVELQQAGYEVVIIDNLSNSNANVIDGIEKITGIRPAFEKVDCCDFEALENVFKKYPKIEGIIHFAASKAVGESVEKPLLYYRNNLTSLINLLELMPKYNVKGIIFSSSCTVYGQPTKENLPVTENALHPLWCSYQEHHPPLFQSYRCASDSFHWRIAQWRAYEPDSVCYPDGYRYPQAVEDIRT